VSDHEGNTPMHLVTASITDTSTARLLIKKGTDVSAVNKQGRTALHLVAAMECERSSERFTKSR
jgi:ankyrin repeat protein